MDRPATSKSRGICRYHTTPRGCFAGDSCKFLHGADETLTPYDKAKVCKYYARGHCIRGDLCWFRHDLPKVTLDDERVRFHSESCCICLEKPTTYGLLTDCSHIFCLECIRQWRTPAGKSPDVVSSGTIKCCPLCRMPSRFVTPSAHFFPNGSSRKKETIDAYKASMARVPCKYFEETSRTGKPCCPFGIDCFYQHINPDGTPHVFRHGAKHFMSVYRRQRFSHANVPVQFDPDDPIEFLQHIFENPITNLHATLDVIRASLPALMERFASGNDSESHGSDDDDEGMDDFIDSFEPLDFLASNDETAISPFISAERDSLRPMPVESTPELVRLPTQTPHLPTLSGASQAVDLPPSVSPTEAQPARLPSGFSAAMGTHARQTFIIDISDEEDEEDEESVQYMLDASPIDSSDPSVAATPLPRPSMGQQSTGSQSVARVHEDMSPGRAQCEHDVDPPFLTDGRGRVVWSSTRNAPARGTESRASRYSRTASASRIVCPSPGPTLLVSNARGYAWGGQDAQGMEEKGGGSEESGDMD